MSDAISLPEMLELDELGRVILPDGMLDDLVKSDGLVSAGANPTYCQGSSNITCTNGGSCTGTTNSGNCTNRTNCNFSNNPVYCA